MTPWLFAAGVARADDLLAAAAYRDEVVVATAAHEQLDLFVVGPKGVLHRRTLTEAGHALTEVAASCHDDGCAVAWIGFPDELDAHGFLAWVDPGGSEPVTPIDLGVATRVTVVDAGRVFTVAVTSAPLAVLPGRRLVRRAFTPPSTLGPEEHLPSPDPEPDPGPAGRARTRGDPLFEASDGRGAFVRVVRSGEVVAGRRSGEVVTWSSPIETWEHVTLASVLGARERRSASPLPFHVDEGRYEVLSGQLTLTLEGPIAGEVVVHAPSPDRAGRLADVAYQTEGQALPLAMGELDAAWSTDRPFVHLRARAAGRGLHGDLPCGPPSELSWRADSGLVASWADGSSAILTGSALYTDARSGGVTLSGRWRGGCLAEGADARLTVRWTTGEALATRVYEPDPWPFILIP